MGQLIVGSALGARPQFPMPPSVSEPCETLRQTRVLKAWTVVEVSSGPNEIQSRIVDRKAKQHQNTRARPDHLQASWETRRRLNQVPFRKPYCFRLRVFTFAKYNCRGATAAT